MHVCTSAQQKEYLLLNIYFLVKTCISIFLSFSLSLNFFFFFNQGQDDIEFPKTQDSRLIKKKVLEDI